MISTASSGSVQSWISAFMEHAGEFIPPGLCRHDSHTSSVQQGEAGALGMLSQEGLQEGPRHSLQSLSAGRAGICSEHL